MEIIRKIPILIVIVAFVLLNVPLPSNGYSQEAVDLPEAGTMVPLTPAFSSAMLRGIKVDPHDPFRFKFIVNTGTRSWEKDRLNAEVIKLIKYFLATLTTPEQDMWVNLSPYENDRIVPEQFGATEMGRDLLSQDYLLKQLTASLLYPEEDIGESFWRNVYQKAYEQFGTTEIPTNTFNKIWIVPDTAVVFVRDSTAFVVESHLQVMLEEDYIALKNNINNKKFAMDDHAATTAQPVSRLTSDIIRQIVIPEIEKEVNSGKTFSNLRQMYNAMILATWYKINMRQGILGSLYINKNKISGVDVKDKTVKEKIYNRYIEAFKIGVYNYIREDYDPSTQQVIPRKYFSGGFESQKLFEDIRVFDDMVNLTPQQFVEFLKSITTSRDEQLYADIQARFNLFSSKDQSDIIRALNAFAASQGDGSNAVLLYTISLLESGSLEVAEQETDGTDVSVDNALLPSQDDVGVKPNKDVAINRFRASFNEIVLRYRNKNYENEGQLFVMLQEATEEFQQLIVNFGEAVSESELARTFYEQKNILETELQDAIFSYFDVQEDIENLDGEESAIASKQQVILTYLADKMLKGQKRWDIPEMPELLDVLSRLQNKRALDSINELFAAHLKYAPVSEISRFLKEILPYLLMESGDIDTFEASKNFLIDFLKNNPYSENIYFRAPRFVKHYGVDLFRSRHVFIPVTLDRQVYDGYADKNVLLRTEEAIAALDHEVATGRIKKIGNRYFFPVKMPMPFKLHPERHNRSTEYVVGDRSYIYKGTGMSKGEFLRETGIISNYRLGQRGAEYAFYGGLPQHQSSIVNEIKLRDTYLSLKENNDPALQLAEQYGARIDMILMPIAQASIKALPVLSDPANDNAEAEELISKEMTLPRSVAPPAGIHMIPTEELLEFADIPAESDPVFHLYGTPVNVRLEQITQAKTQAEKVEFLKPVYKYYGFFITLDSDGTFRITKRGEEVSPKEVAENILISAAARYGLFVHMLHKHLNGQAHEDVYTVFSEHNTNPITLFDYDTLSYNLVYLDDAERLGKLSRDVNDAKKILFSLAKEMGLSEYFPQAEAIFDQVLYAEEGVEGSLDVDNALLTSESLDQASDIKRADPVGGINLEAAMLKLEVRRDGSGIPLPIDQQPLNDMNINGFFPVIIDVTPLQPLHLLQGSLEKNMDDNFNVLASSSE